MPHEEDKTARRHAYELFGEMRPSTPEEQELMRRVYERHSTTIPGINVLDLLSEAPDGEPIDLGIDIFELDEARTG